MLDPTPGSYTAIFANGIGQFTGISLGVVAGTVVTILVKRWEQSRDEGKQIANLKFELSMNIKKIEGWLGEFGKYRNALNGDSMHEFYGYFKLSSAVNVITNQLLQSGLIYEHLSHEHIGQLQEVFNDCSNPGENYLNNQIFQRKQEFISLRENSQLAFWQTSQKPLIVREIDSWEQKFKSHSTSLKSILKALDDAT